MKRNTFEKSNTKVICNTNEKCNTKSVRRRSFRKGWLVMLAVFVGAGLFTFLNRNYGNVEEEAEAASLANFDPGYIISDYQMGNYNSMSVGEIAAFLKAKGNCNYTNLTHGVSRGYENYTDASGVAYNYRVTFGGGAVRYYHVENGHFVCLADESFNGKSAAEIIYEAAQDYRINPQVLIVLLQKEQSLITDNFPNNVQYRSATGYGCPDTAACNSEYYGFRNQVRKAAALFRTVLDGGWTNYPLGSNYVQYNPSAACGGSVVNIRSLATSALYRYTPYQPNASAIAAGYGTGDGCGAYGNRNFYLYFEDWFGGATSDGWYANMKQGVVEDGLYRIYSTGTGVKAIGVDGMGVEANVSADKLDETAMQFWRITKVDDYYTIVNEDTGKALDVTNAVFRNNVNVWQHTLNRTCAQRWLFAEDTNGGVVIYNACEKDFVLDLQDGKSNIQIYTKTKYDNKNQKWVLKKVKAAKKDYSGVYNILSARNSRALEVSGSGDGANVAAKSDVGVSTQIWRVEKIEGYYTIVNSATNKALDVANASFNNNTNIWQYGLNYSCAQRWLFEENDDGGVIIYNACDPDYVLDLQDGNTNLQIYTRSVRNNNNQNWVLRAAVEDDYSGTYVIVSANDKNKAMDVNGANDGGNVLTGAKNKTASQKWQIEKVDNYYTIVNSATNKALDVANASFNNNTNIWQYGLNYSCAQRWLFDKNPDGSVTIYNACDFGYVLDLQNSDTNVQIYTRTSYANNNQKWFLSEIDN